MPSSTSSRVLRAARSTLIPAAYLSIAFWRPYDSYGGSGRECVFPICGVLMTAVLLVSLLSWRTHRVAAVLGLSVCFLWLAVTLLPVL
jgi:hypothetical protein